MTECKYNSHFKSVSQIGFVSGEESSSQPDNSVDEGRRSGLS